MLDCFVHAVFVEVSLCARQYVDTRDKLSNRAGLAPCFIGSSAPQRTWWCAFPGGPRSQLFDMQKGHPSMLASERCWRRNWYYQLKLRVEEIFSILSLLSGFCFFFFLNHKWMLDFFFKWFFHIYCFDHIDFLYPVAMTDYFIPSEYWTRLCIPGKNPTWFGI